MTGDGDQNIEAEWLRDLPLRSEEIGFKPDELIACKSCGKPNPPTRNACLYCGAGMEGSGTSKQLDIREAESWENGFNVVLLDVNEAAIDRAALRLASLLGTARETVTAVLTAGKIIPLRRVQTESAAAGISAMLAEFGIQSITVADDSLQPASAPTRLRSIDFDGGDLRLELFNVRETISLRSDDLALVVPGMIFEARTESIEKRKRSGPETLHETAVSSDEPVIDIYSRSDPAGWRIPAKGFDFSSLGSKKTLLASENMKTLISKLIEFSPSAKFADDYVKVRTLLEFSWPSETRRDTQRVEHGKKEVSKVFTTNNSMQFTKYSRLQWRLL